MASDARCAYGDRLVHPRGNRHLARDSDTVQTGKQKPEEWPMTAVLEDPVRDRDGVEYRPRWEHVAFYVFVWVPLGAVFAGLALAAAGRTLSWLSLGLAVGFYVVTAHGVTVGYHRLFTHSAFKANRALKIGLAIAGSMAIQGGVIRWVADHRKHHQHSDGPMDPHSPWRFGSGPRQLARG